MGDSGARRQRAVRLTNDALRRLQRRLIDDWEELSMEGRLTRGARAGLMQVSVGTAERILKQKGNDRAILQQAFVSVGLEWEDSNCEPMPTPALSGEGLDEAPVHGEEKEPRRRVVLWPGASRAAVTAFVLCTPMLLATVLGTRLPAQSPVAVPSPEEPGPALAVAWSAYHSGAYEDAIGKLEIATKLAAKSGDVGAMAEAIRLEGEVCAAQGRDEDAIAFFNDALVLLSKFPFDWARGSLLEVVGVAEMRLRRFESAERHMMESHAVLKSNADWRGVASTSRSLGSLAAARGNRASAKSWFASARDVMKDDPDPQLVIDIKAQEAMLSAADGQTDQALRDLNQCLTEWKQRGHERWMATTLLQIAKVRGMRNERPQVVVAASEAKEKFEAVGDRRGVAACSELLSSAIRE